MSNPTYNGLEDDLPRTLRREKEAQARRAREQAGPELGAPMARVEEGSHSPPADYAEDEFYDPPSGTVTRLEIPFFHLMAFFIKAVLAAIPALILLGALLWISGEILTAYFPDLVKVQILIRMPE